MMATSVIFWSTPFLFLLSLSTAAASGLFEFRIDSFENPLARDQDGNCCSNSTIPPLIRSSFYPSDSSYCSSPCRVYFRICLKHFQHNIDTNTPCTFGEVTTHVLGDNRLEGHPYTVPLHFNFSWPKYCSYIVDIGHESFEGSRTKEGMHRIIYQHKMQTSLQVASDWTYKSYEVGSRSKARFNYAIRVTCDENHYGDDCSTMCRPRNDDYGHFTCSEKGQIVCLSGWQGEKTYCRNATCLPGCHTKNGYCDQPNECKCRYGWEGSHCDRCIKHPGCLHGTCEKPFQCICNEGWGGMFCNQGS